MKARNVTSIKPQPLELPILEQPINVINANLDQAHAGLDLLMTLACEAGPGADVGLGLCNGTLVNAVNGAMLCIERAKEAANKTHEVSHG